MKKAMISQPMKNVRTEAEILETKKRAEETLKSMGYEVVNTYFDDEWANPENMKKRGIPESNIPVAFMAKSIEKMAECQAVYFCKGWDETRGCLIEHEIAEKYGLTVLYEQ